MRDFLNGREQDLAIKNLYSGAEALVNTNTSVDYR
jgi:hypothetical protein